MSLNFTNVAKKKKKVLKLNFKILQKGTNSTFLHVVTNLYRVQSHHGCTLLALNVTIKAEKKKKKFRQVFKVPVGMAQPTSIFLLLTQLGKDKISLDKQLCIFVICFPQGRPCLLCDATLPN